MTSAVLTEDTRLLAALLGHILQGQDTLVPAPLAPWGGLGGAGRGRAVVQQPLAAHLADAVPSLNGKRHRVHDFHSPGLRTCPQEGDRL